jgi:hypothetical protein
MDSFITLLISWLTLAFVVFMTGFFAYSFWRWVTGPSEPMPRSRPDISEEHNWLDQSRE